MGLIPYLTYIFHIRAKQLQYFILALFSPAGYGLEQTVG